MRRKTLILGAALAGSLLITVIASYAALTYRITGRGTIYVPPTVRVGVYAYSNCTAPVTEIDWGTLSPGDVGTRTVYVRNEGDTPVSLTLSTANWNPSQAPQYISLRWNYTGQLIPVSRVTCVAFSLLVSSTLTRDKGITDFSFEIVITAEG